MYGGKEKEPGVAGLAPEEVSAEIDTTENVRQPGAEGDNYLLTQALAWAAKGIPVFPCKNTPGELTHKAPHTCNGFKDATTDAETIRAWWARWPNALIGVPTGKRSGFNVIDIDRKNGKDGTKAIPNWPNLSPVITLTVSNGIHLWFRSTGEVRGRNGLFEGVDLKADGGYVIVPPSSGYSWAEGKELGDLSNLPELPEELRPQQRQSESSSSHEQKTGPSGDVDPERLRAALRVIDADNRDIWIRVGIALCNELGDQGYDIWAEWAQTSPKWDPHDGPKTWDSLKKYPEGNRAGTIFELAWEVWQNEIDRLAAISTIDYEHERVEAATKLGVRVGVLDAEVERARGRLRPEDDEGLQGQALNLTDIEPWPDAVVGDQLLSDIVAQIRRHVILTEEQAIAVALWCVHAHALDCADHSPRLHASSPLKRCGKTVLLSCINPLVPRALGAENITVAALFRVIEMARALLSLSMRRMPS